MTEKLVLMLPRASGAFESFSLRTVAYPEKAVPLGVSSDTAPCVVHPHHHPLAATRELHHVFPLELQKKIWPEVTRDDPATVHDKTLIAVCGTGHNNIHFALSALLADSGLLERPYAVDRGEWALAQDALRRYQEAQSAKAP